MRHLRTFQFGSKHFFFCKTGVCFSHTFLYSWIASSQLKWNTLSGLAVYRSEKSIISDFIQLGITDKDGVVHQQWHQQQEQPPWEWDKRVLIHFCLRLFYKWNHLHKIWIGSLQSEQKVIFHILGSGGKGSLYSENFFFFNRSKPLEKKNLWRMRKHMRVQMKINNIWKRC